MKDKIKKVLEALGWKKSASDLDNDERIKVAAKYKEMFNGNLLDDLKQEQENAELARKYGEVLSVLNEDDDPNHDQNANLADVVAGLKKENTKLRNTVEKDDPKTIKVDISAFSRQHSKTHLFSIESDFFSLGKRWNAIMVNPKMAKMDDLSAADDKRVFAAFQKETEDFGASLAKRFNFLQSIGQLPKKGAAFTQTYTDLATADLGAQFVVIRQDALIARIQELPNVYDIFPRRFGVQDRELMTNAFFGEFSQAFQTGAVYKGAMELQAEIGYVDDAMFKTLFESMKWLERQYVGYLNKEGSDPMKWSLIEWTILQIATKLTMEQYERRILGIYVKPVATEAGHYMHASTGFVYSLLRYIHENKLQPFTEAGFASYDNTGTSMVDFVVAMYEKVKSVTKNFQENQNVMLLNANHKYWYRSQVRSKFALHQDFTGPIDTLVPDTNLPIVWVPNMGQIPLAVVTKPGNFQALENLPGEMLGIQFQADMESYKAWSTWKEGFSATFVGKKFTTPALLLANLFDLQEVFMNQFSTDLDADATTADATVNFWFKTAANGGATVLTDFAGAVGGVAYVLENGSTTNDTTVTKENKFSEIVSTYTPTLVGDYLMVVYDTTASKFFELERCVNGVRTINALKQPYADAR